MRFAPFALLVVGCASDSQLWLLQIEYVESNCDVIVDENFVEAQAPDDDEPSSEWTYTEEGTYSPRLVVARLTNGPGTQATLTFDGLVYPGTREGDAYTFTWENRVDDIDIEEHESGYRFESAVETVATSTLVLSRDTELKGLSGTWTASSTQKESWLESDEWDFELTGIAGGQIPSAAWLDGSGVANEPAQEDCSVDPCVLSVEVTCAADVPISATRYDRQDHGGFAGLSAAGQPYGFEE